MPNSTAEHLDCKGSIILFLKLQVKINLQLLENSSVNALNNNWTSLLVLSASSIIMTLWIASDERDTVDAKFFAVFLTVSKNLPSSDPLITY